MANLEKEKGPLVFGEVLFDHFPDGGRVLGGAPFNVAWHLRGFGYDPLVISAVGPDEPGSEVLERMEAWGMRTDGVQLGEALPTGRVSVRSVAGEPQFNIEPEQAYDYIDAERAAQIAGDNPLLYHGSLALRSAVSRRTLARLRETATATVFVDINLRTPWWTEERVHWCMQGADWLKLNETELGTLTRVSTETREPAIAMLAEELDIATVLLTQGAGGAMAWSRGKITRAERVTVRDIGDSVGAGDAFSSVTCVGILRGWDIATTLNRANAFAADICRIRGATAANESLYESHLVAWGADG